MRKRWVLLALLSVVLLELAVLSWLWLGIEFTCPCGGCEGKAHNCRVGTCQACGVKGSMPTTSDVFCDSCATAKGVCKDCGQKKRLVVRAFQDPAVPR
jgi:hypothetical protein